MIDFKTILNAAVMNLQCCTHSYPKSPDFGYYYPKRVALHIYMQHSHASR